MNRAPRSAASLGRRAIGARIPRPLPDALLSSPAATASMAAAVTARRSTTVGRADEAKAELSELGRIRGRRGLEHQVAARLGLREGHDLPDVGLVREQR